MMYAGLEVNNTIVLTEYPYPNVRTEASGNLYWLCQLGVLSPFFLGHHKTKYAIFCIIYEYAFQ